MSLKMGWGMFLKNTPSSGVMILTNHNCGRVRHYRHGAHTKTDLKAHIVWVPKYRKKVLIGPVAVRVRDLIRQIAMEHELT